MEMLDLQTLIHLFGRKVNHPNYPDVKEVGEDTVYFDSLTRGLGISGNPGEGKTTTASRILMDYVLKYENRPAVVFDASGGLTTKFLQMMEALPPDKREGIRARTVVDLLGYSWVIPKPLFHTSYGLSQEEQVQKAVNILKELNHEMMELTPIMATAIKVTAPQLFSLISVIKGEDGAPWQLTEAKNLLIDNLEDGLLERAIKKFGDHAPSAKFYLNHEVMKKLAPASRESRIGSLLTALNVIETDYLRARYGFSKPGITYKEIIDDGLIYLVSGELLGNKDDAQAWIFWEEFASLRSIINQRIPDNPEDPPVPLFIDEVYRLFEIKGMAKALGQISTYYRSRKLMPVIIIQAFWQLDKLLQEQYWNLGNLMTFQMDNFNDAYKLSQQLFKYDEQAIKFNAPSDRSNPLVETDRGQYLSRANWIQNLGERSVLMRRYLDEGKKEEFVAYVDETKHVELATMNPKEIFELKEKMVKESGRAVHFRDALRVINARDIKIKKEKPKRKTIKRTK